MSDIFDRYKDGDTRNIWVTVKKGDREVFKGGEVLVFKKRCRVEVTQRWDGNTCRWVDTIWDSDNALPMPTFWERVAGWFRRKTLPKATLLKKEGTAS